MQKTQIQLSVWEDPHVTEQLSPCATMLSLCSRVRGATTTDAPAMQTLCSATRETTSSRSWSTQNKSSPRWPQLEKNREDPAQPKINCCCWVTKLCLTLCDPTDYSKPDFPVLHYLPNLLKLMSVESGMPSNHLILCHLLLLLPSIFCVFSNTWALRIRWPKYWSFSFSISPSSEYSQLIFLSIHWFDALVVQGILKSVLQHCNSKAAILQRSPFFWVQLSHPYITTGKTIALT